MVVADPDHRRSDCGQRARCRRLQGQDHLRRDDADREQQIQQDKNGKYPAITNIPAKTAPDASHFIVADAANAAAKNVSGVSASQLLDKLSVKPTDVGEAELSFEGASKAEAQQALLRLRRGLRRLPPGSAASADRADTRGRAAIRRRRSPWPNRRRHDPGLARRHQQPRSRPDRRARHQDLALRVAGPGDAGRPAGGTGDRHPGRAGAEPLRPAGAPCLRPRAAGHRRLRGDARGARRAARRPRAVGRGRPWRHDHGQPGRRRRRPCRRRPSWLARSRTPASRRC